MNDVRILLDTPTTKPALGFEAAATALATLIENSEPRFAVGVFGGWGSGKTTLMRAIQQEMNRADTLKVFFNAWRYEREPHLIVPLLDTIRATLMEWSAAQSEPTRDRVRGIAARVGQVVRAMARGLSAEVSVPGFAKMKYDLGKVVDSSDWLDAEHGQSLYFACFEELQSAFGELFEAGAGRIVVFVDDLDRCLPSSALDVIESMKLFFDLKGFVFVVGIDQTVLERAVHARISTVLGTESTGPATTTRARRAEREYIKKIFQVPFELPPMGAEQLDELLESVYQTADLPAAQLIDLNERVRPFLAHIAVDGQVNPREIKRFINAYILQMLVRPYLDRNTVLAVQTIAFRDEWGLYDTLLSEAGAFSAMVRSYREGQSSALFDMWPALGVLSTDLVRFLRSAQAASLAVTDLRPYVTSVERVVPVEAWLADSYRALGHLRRTVYSATEAARDPNRGTAIEAVGRALWDAVDRLTVLVSNVPDAERLTAELRRLRDSQRRLHGSMSADAVQEWIGEGEATIVVVQHELRLLRRFGLAPLTGG